MLKTQLSLKSWTWYPFTLANLSQVPQVPGVYCLGKGETIIYIGSSGNLYQRLRDHYYTTDPCIRQADHFAIEPCSDYEQREQALLRWHLSEYGRLPACNDRI